MMFQEFSLFPWKTVRGNIAWGSGGSGRSGSRIEETVGSTST
jgi:ABC-type nitrate/sulfonate/bicarbonate transport system ATPase subunit